MLFRSSYNKPHPITFKPFEPKDMGAQYYPCPGGNHEDIIHPITKKICKKPAKGWKWISSTLQDRLRYKKSEIVRGKNLIIAGRTKYGLDETTIPRQVYYLEDAIHHALPTMITLPHSLGKSDLPDGISFSTPKPVNLIKNLLKSVKKDDITVLDYFAGSGATAQAVYELNNHDGGSRSWIMVEEMGTTFHEVLLPRIKHFDPKNHFSTFELKTANIGDKSLLNMFNDYSFEFLSAYHQVSDNVSVMIGGLNVIGFEERSEKVVAMTIPTLRNHENSFIEELAALKDAIKKTKAKSAVIYTIRNEG